MAQFAATNTFVSGAAITASGHNTNWSDVTTWLNNRYNGTDTWTVVKGATLEATTLLKGKGTATNDNATTGYVGEVISSTQATPTNFPLTGVIGDAVNVSLTAGDWDVCAGLEITANGATVTEVFIGISATSGNSSTGLNGGDNKIACVLPTTVQNGGGFIASFRISLSSTTTYYLKRKSTFSVATPQFTCRLSARRAR